MAMRNYGTFTPDEMSGGRDQDFAPIDAGKYNAYFYSHEDKKTKNGNDMISCQFRVAEDQPFAGRVLFHNIVITPNTRNILLTFFTALGITAEPNAPVNVDLDLLHGKLVNLTVARVKDDYRNQKDGTTNQYKNEIKYISAPETNAPTPPPAPATELLASDIPF